MIFLKMKTKRKAKLNWLPVTVLSFLYTRISTCSPSLVLRNWLLLYFSMKTKSSVRYHFLNIGIVFATRSRSCWRGEYKPGSSPEPLALKAPLFTWSVQWLLPHAVWSRCFVERSDTDISHTLSSFIFQTYRISPTNRIDASLVNIYSTSDAVSVFPLRCKDEFYWYWFHFFGNRPNVVLY